MSVSSRCTFTTAYHLGIQFIASVCLQANHCSCVSSSEEHPFRSAAGTQPSVCSLRCRIAGRTMHLKVVVFSASGLSAPCTSTSSGSSVPHQHAPGCLMHAQALGRREHHPTGVQVRQHRVQPSWRSSRVVGAPEGACRRGLPRYSLPWGRHARPGRRPAPRTGPAARTLPRPAPKGASLTAPARRQRHRHSPAMHPP